MPSPTISVVIYCGGHSARLPCRATPIVVPIEELRNLQSMSMAVRREGWVLDLVRLEDAVTANPFCLRCAKRLDLLPPKSDA